MNILFATEVAIGVGFGGVAVDVILVAVLVVFLHRS